MISVSVVRVPLSTAQPLIIMDSPVSSRVIDCSSNIESVYAYSIESIEVYKKYMKFSNSNFKNTKKKDPRDHSFGNVVTSDKPQYRILRGCIKANPFY